MKSTKGLLWRVSGAVVVGIVLLLAIGVGAIRMLTEVDPWPVFEAMDLGWLLAAVLGFVFGNILVGHRFLAMLSEDTPAHREPWRVGSLFFGASVFSLVLPGPVGELAACAALKKRYGIVFSRGLATAVHARLVGLASAALMAIAVLPFVEVSSNLGEVLRVGAAMVCVAGLGVGVLTAMPSWMQWVSTTVERSPLARVLGSAMILIRALSETGRAPLRTWLKVLAWSVVIQGVQSSRSPWWAWPWVSSPRSPVCFWLRERVASAFWSVSSCPAGSVRTRSLSSRASLAPVAWPSRAQACSLWAFESFTSWDSEVQGSCSPSGPRCSPRARSWRTSSRRRGGHESMRARHLGRRCLYIRYR